MADALDLARVSWARAMHARADRDAAAPLVRLSAVPVEPPPGAFLQATAFGEARPWPRRSATWAPAAATPSTCSPASAP